MNKVTVEQIEALIAREFYTTADKAFHYAAKPDLQRMGPANAQLFYSSLDEALMCLTWCVLVLKNGFTVTGESACVSPENFDAEVGRKIARQKAVDKIWQLEGYLLKSQLCAAPTLAPVSEHSHNPLVDE